MTDKVREAAQQALEALESIGNSYFGFDDDVGECASCGERSWRPHAPDCQKTNAITALRKVLAEPVQEPVAWMHNEIEDNIITHRPSDIDRHPERWTALYKEPLPCPTCESLARAVMLDQASYDSRAVAEPVQEPVHTLTCVCGAGWDIKPDGTEEMAHPPATGREPVAWRVRGYNQFKTGTPGPWRYFDGAGKPDVNTPENCDFEQLYAASPQRKPLSSDKDRPDQNATFVEGYGYVHTAAVRAIERAHGITGENT